MKANRVFRKRFDNDRAEVGIGTLIVFIAMVLVAAVAAAVLINTSGTLQQRAQQTGKDATTEVSSNLKVIGVYGVRNASDDVKEIKINVELSAGALDMDLQKLIVRNSDSTATRNLEYGGTANLTHFTLSWIRGTGTNQVMEAGDLVEITYSLVDYELGNREDVEVLLIPETGTPLSADFQTPATYGTKTTITLR